MAALIVAARIASAGDKPRHKLSGEIEREVPEKGIKPPTRRSARASRVTKEVKAAKR